MKLIKIFYSILLFSINIDSFKILIFVPNLGYSHLTLNGKIGDILSNAGHDVTIIKTNLERNLSMIVKKNVNLIDISVNESIREMANSLKLFDNLWESDNNIKNSIIATKNFTDLMYYLCEFMFDQDELTTKIRNEKYDIMISEYINVCGIILGKHYNIDKFLYISSMTNNELIYDYYGLFFPSSYIPTTFLKVSHKMTIFERWFNFLFYYSEKFFYKTFVIPKFENIYEKKNNKYISFDNLAKTSGGILINTYPFIDKPTPINLKTYFIGGITLNEIKNLPKKWDDILNLRKYNILVSFGTIVNVSNAPLKTKNAMLRAFESFNSITFIWKYEESLSTLPINIPENVVIIKWIPQYELLNDDRINIFITHCGMNSIIEATYVGKPILCIPFFGDQMRNSGLVYRLGFSEYFDKKRLSNENELKDIIKKMIKSHIYQIKANRVSKLAKYFPYSPKDIVVKVIEYIGKNGNINELNLEGGDLSIIEFFNLDICFIIFIILIAKILLILKLLKLILNYCFPKKEKIE
ncbi:UDP-glucuronosyl/UDP-glucosyltransferase family-containing protein [Strongyloides ratti]|uniref:glucuronosyltransferase n=1 Tax=Strongyloides ratti TaxID=34506 RepID=A0A090LJ59_STRRB|nr:UDP-glucuronosyl/UDP-glucosyltransferase family-containing protein [Strongyloides ratti]CEF69857.1 UDP-glucuronosyl/UDP-glucosyltransferase family-containing protein [Strongyloides ratti]